MALNRNKILDALVAVLQAVPGIKSVSRKVKQEHEVSPAEQPALFVFCSEQDATHTKGAPSLWRLTCDVFVYLTSESREGTAPAMMSLLDGIEATLEDHPLGAQGLRVHLNGIETDAGLGPKAVAVVTLEILATA